MAHQGTEPEAADFEVGADTAAVPEAGVVGAADLADLPDLVGPLAVLVADLAALLDFAAGRALLADLATGRGGPDDLAEALARAFLVEADVTGEDGRFWPVDGAGDTDAGVSEEAGFSSNASATESDDSSLSTTDFLRSRRDRWSIASSSAASSELDRRRVAGVTTGAGVGVAAGGLDDRNLVGGLRADLDVDPAEALVGCGEARRVDGGAGLTEPAETAGRGRTVDSGAEVTTMEETKLDELVTGAADAVDPEGGIEHDAETCTDGRVTGVSGMCSQGLGEAPPTARGSQRESPPTQQPTNWKSVRPISAARKLELNSAPRDH
ncbi:unnamed protein product [Phytophthora fragariaefolia]|uniref:Unnamed protein product n=1 Tax=Phytophthora fragariaefolia TaxID=1490495 RepID=A0A9W6X8A0_9STRA|nr:unnamed protein product [Phytophthora fragariaefolia]